MSRRPRKAQCRAKCHPLTPSQRVVDAVRECLGMAPLYARDPLAGRPEVERFFVRPLPD